jgi:carboxylate-amine ligase
VNAGVIEDASRIWWDIRPSARFPTLEMRIPDLCTRFEDALCIAAIYRCWLRMLYRLRRDNQRWRRYSAMLISENRWRAQRYGFEKGLVDFGRGEVVPYKDLVDDYLALIREDAEHFGCVAEVEHARQILARGTSAHWQIRAYDEARAAGADENEALKSVVDLLIKETLHGISSS